MNEAGLVIEQMWWTGPYIRSPTSGSALRNFNGSCINWITRPLWKKCWRDSVVRLSTQSTLRFISWSVDKSGNMATIEFINGQRTVHTETSMPYSAPLSNDSYEKSLAFVNGTLSGGQDEATPYTRSSLNRFATAAGW
jgi:hypothetical protein